MHISVHTKMMLSNVCLSTLNFHEWKWWNADSNFTEVCSWWSNWQYPSIGLDNGVALNRRQTIIWTNADPIHWRIYETLGGDGLNGHDYNIECAQLEIFSSISSTLHIQRMLYVSLIPKIPPGVKHVYLRNYVCYLVDFHGVSCPS